MLLIMDNSKLSVDGMVCYHVNLELGQDDNLTSAKTKILTKINTEIRKIKTSFKSKGGDKVNTNTNMNMNYQSNLTHTESTDIFFKMNMQNESNNTVNISTKELSVIKNIKLLDGTQVESTADLSGPCDIFIVSASTISSGLDWESLSVIPDIDKLEKIFKVPQFAFKIFLFLGKRFIDNLKDQHKLEIQTVKMAEII